jgi:hypothetical protein
MESTHSGKSTQVSRSRGRSQAGRAAAAQPGNVGLRGAEKNVGAQHGGCPAIAFAIRTAARNVILRKRSDRRILETERSSLPRSFAAAQDDILEVGCECPNGLFNGFHAVPQSGGRGMPRPYNLALPFRPVATRSPSLRSRHSIIVTARTLRPSEKSPTRQSRCGDGPQNGAVREPPLPVIFSASFAFSAVHTRT